MSGTRLLSDGAEYRRVRDHLAARFRLAARLPDLVLRHPPRLLAFFEFDEVFGEGFWSSLRTLASRDGDAEVLFAAVEPDAEGYFHRHFGYFAAFALPVASSADEYLDAMCFEPPDSPADALLYNGWTLAFASPSGGLAVWADRELEIGLLALFGPSGAACRADLPDGVRWLDVHGALEVMAPAFAGGRVPDGVRRGLLAHYG